MFHYTLNHEWRHKSRRDPAGDVAELRSSGATVLVGTPGRLADVLTRVGGGVDLKRLEVLVLDEADRLLDMGFQPQLDSLMARLPKQRRTGVPPQGIIPRS